MITHFRHCCRLVTRTMPVVAGIAVLGSGIASAAAKPVPLAGSVGPGYVISLKTASGKPVKTLKAGTYAITVTDRAAIHMFHLIGPGVHKVITGISFRGKKTSIVTLKPGKYIYQCDPHKSVMKKSFVVTS